MEKKMTKNLDKNSKELRKIAIQKMSWPGAANADDAAADELSCLAYCPCLHFACQFGDLLSTSRGLPMG